MKNRKYNWLILTLVVLLGTFPLYAVQYYVNTVAAEGGDGTTQALTGANCAWNQISDIAGLAAGDTVSFNKGNTWREQLTVSSSGSAGNQITFNAYGTGADPIINGADVIETWTQSSTWVDTFTQSFTSNATSGGDYNMRMVIPASACTEDGTKIRVTYTAHVSTESTVAGISIGTRSGSGMDYSAAPTRITWDTGSSTLLATAGLVKVSDEMTFTFNSEVDHLIHIFWDTLYAWAYTSSGANGIYYDTAGGDLTMTEDVTLASEDSDRKASISKIEVYQASSAYQATCTTEPTQVWYDGTILTENDGATTGVGADEWDWAANVLYVNVGEDPDTGTLEAAARDRGIYGTGKSYITIDGIHIKYTNEGTSSGGIEFINTSGNGIIQNCTIEYTAGLGGIYLGSGSDGWTISDNTISYNTHSTADWASGILLNDSDSNTVSGNTVHHNDGHGIRLYISTASHSNTVSTNTVYQNGSSGISVMTDCDDNVIEFNTVYENGQVTNDQYNINMHKVGDNNIVRYNLTHDINYISTSAGGIRFDGGSEAMPHDTIGTGNQIYYNICYNEYTGISVYRCVDGIVIYNNVIYNSTYHGIRIADENSDVNLCKNNIIHTAGTALIYHSLSTNSDINYNCYYDTDYTDKFYWDGVSYSTFADWKTNSSQDANSPTPTDPLMTDPATDDLTLQSTSPCIDVGIDVSLTQDYNSVSVPLRGDMGTNKALINVGENLYIIPGDATEGSPDIGAYEYIAPYKIGIDGYLYLRLTETHYLRMNQPKL